jgi:hypothetical protein
MELSIHITTARIKPCQRIYIIEDFIKTENNREIITETSNEYPISNGSGGL